jgi:hypothetical protein
VAVPSGGTERLGGGADRRWTSYVVSRAVPVPVQLVSVAEVRGIRAMPQGRGPFSPDAEEMARLVDELVAAGLIDPMAS